MVDVVENLSELEKRSTTVDKELLVSSEVLPWVLEPSWDRASRYH